MGKHSIHKLTQGKYYHNLSSFIFPTRNLKTKKVCLLSDTRQNIYIINESFGNTNFQVTKETIMVA